MASRLFDVKSLSEPVMAYFLVGIYEQTSMKF